MKKTFLLAFVAGALLAASAHAADGVTIEKKSDTQLDVMVNGELFTSYNYSNEAKKPYLWPVYSEGNVGITRNFPMAPDEKPVKDHPHHKGIWTSYGDLRLAPVDPAAKNGVDCWGEQPGSGFQNTDEVTSGTADGYGWIKAKNTWQDKDHKPVIAENREYRFYASPAGARYFDVAVTFTAAYGTVLFKDTKEGGLLSFRIRNDLTETSKNGVITNSAGGKGSAECWGKPAQWTDYYGEVKGKGLRGIAVFDHPGNMRHPTTWHIRDYGLNGANCFGYSHFTDGKENGDYTLENGQSVTFNYRVVIHSGSTEDAGIAKMFEEYAKTPAIK